MSTLGAAVAAQSGVADPKIQAGREAALAVLKPAKRDLERGLELHKHSLVIEPYGFSPRSSVDGDRIRQAIEAGASEIEIQDLTEDSMMTRARPDCVSSVFRSMLMKTSSDPAKSCSVEKLLDDTRPA